MDYTLAEREIACPFCGERISLLLDLSAGDQSYVEDCQVCCRPMQVTLQADDTGGDVDVQVDCAS